jgi:hypothetical protein
MFAARFFSTKQAPQRLPCHRFAAQNPREDRAQAGIRVKAASTSATINGDHLAAVFGAEWQALRLSNSPFSNAPMLCHDGSSLGSNSRGSTVSNKIRQPPIPHGDSQ